MHTLTSDVSDVGAGVVVQGFLVVVVVVVVVVQGSLVVVVVVHGFLVVVVVGSSVLWQPTLGNTQPQAPV